MAVAQYRVHGDAMTVEPQLNAAGTGIEDVHAIPYTIESGPAAGARRTVKVPHSKYTVNNVQAAIESDVATAHGIASLGNQAPPR